MNSDLKLKERVKRGEITPQEALRIMVVNGTPTMGPRAPKTADWLHRRWLEREDGK